MKLILAKGATSVSVNVFIRDNSVSTGVGLTGLVFNTASLTAYYSRQNAAATAISLVTQTATGAYSSGGFVAVDGTNMPGIYRLDIPDAVLASGVNSVYIMLKGAANMEPCVIEIELTTIDLQAARVDANVTHFGGTAGTFSAGRPEANATHFAGTAYATAQTAENAALLATVVEGSTTVVQSLRLANTANGGKASGMATTTAVLRDLGDTKNRVSATVDANGNRTAVTLDLT
jgi:hypothetical protein